jgi:hypothetical protein
VTAVITSANSDGLLHFRIKVGWSTPPLPSSWAVQAVIYPGMIQVPTLVATKSKSAHVPPTLTNDGVLHPCFDGAFLPNPGQTATTLGSASGWMNGQTLRQCGAAQFVARVTDQAGLLLATQDTSGAVRCSWFCSSNIPLGLPLPPFTVAATKLCRNTEG